jgi:hypothetical protein
MKVKMRFIRKGTPLFEGLYEVSDSKSFADACAELWTKLAERNLASASSIGAAFEALSDSMVPDLDGTQIEFEKVDP